jgi:hypothetical protein
MWAPVVECGLQISRGIIGATAVFTDVRNHSQISRNEQPTSTAS